MRYPVKFHESDESPDHTKYSLATIDQYGNLTYGEWLNSERWRNLETGGIKTDDISREPTPGNVLEAVRNALGNFSIFSAKYSDIFG